MIFLAVKLLVGVFILLIDVKMTMIVGILTFMSRTHFVVSWVEHEKKCCFFNFGARIQFCNAAFLCFIKKNATLLIRYTFLDANEILT